MKGNKRTGEANSKFKASCDQHQACYHLSLGGPPIAMVVHGLSNLCESRYIGTTH